MKFIKFDFELTTAKSALKIEQDFEFIADLDTNELVEIVNNRTKCIESGVSGKYVPSNDVPILVEVYTAISVYLQPGLKYLKEMLNKIPLKRNSLNTLFSRWCDYSNLIHSSQSWPAASDSSDHNGTQ